MNETPDKLFQCYLCKCWLHVSKRTEYNQYLEMCADCFDKNVQQLARSGENNLVQIILDNLKTDS